MSFIENVLSLSSWTVRHLPAWFPGAGFKHTAVLWAESLVNMVEQPYRFVKQQMVGRTISFSLYRISHSTFLLLPPHRLRELRNHPLLLASSKTLRRSLPSKNTKLNGLQLHYIRVVRIRHVYFIFPCSRTHPINEIFFLDTDCSVYSCILLSHDPLSWSSAESSGRNWRCRWTGQVAQLCWQRKIAIY